MNVGPLPDRLKHTCEVSLVVIHALEGMIRPGLIVDEPFAEGDRIAIYWGLAHDLMGHGSGKAGLVRHGLGLLELDENAVLTRDAKVPLELGMVAAVEPKFAVPGFARWELRIPSW